MHSVILVETMGPLHIWSEPPGRVAELYKFFEDELHLQRLVIRTDCKFATIDEAVDLGTFFFGDEVEAEIARIGDVVVPEATAVGDPAIDIAGTFYLGELSFAKAVLSAYGRDDDGEMLTRARFYCACRGDADIRYGLQQGAREYIDGGMRAFEHTLAA